MLRRAGHTEAAVDLARMAGHDAGRRAVRNSQRHGRPGESRAAARAGRAEFELPIISIEQLIAYRRVREKLVYREAEAELPTKYGTGRIIAYGVKYESQQPLVFVLGDPTKVAAPLVRLHSSCFTGDLLESLRCDCGDQLHMALDMISQRRRRRARLLAAGRPRHRPGRKDQGLRAARSRARHGRSESSRSATRPTRATTASASNCSKTSACARCGCSRTIRRRPTPSSTAASIWKSSTRSRSCRRSTSTTPTIWRRSATRWGTICRGINSRQRHNEYEGSALKNSSEALAF